MWNLNLRRLCAAAMTASTSTAWSFTAPSELKVAVAGIEGTLVAFVLPELESCQKLEPHWDAIQQAESATAVVDCSKEAKYCLSQDVRTHPAIRAFFPDGTFSRYRGPREADEVLSFFKRSRSPLITTDPPPTFPASDDITILAYLPPKAPQNALLYEQLEEVAGRYGDRYSFGLQVVGEEEAAALRCWNNVDGTEFGIADFERVGAVEGFVRGCGEPLVKELSRRNELSITQTGKSLVTYLSTTPADKKAYTEAIRPLAKRYAEYLAFVTADAEEYPDMAASMGHLAGARGVLAITNTRTGEVFPMRVEGADAEGVEGFILAVSRGEVVAWDGTPVAKGQPEGEQQQSHDEL